MNLIVPQSMIHERRYICTVCGFKYRRISISTVDKCPICIQERGIVSTAYERGYEPNSGKTLDPYSAQKERWYADPKGRSHVESIKRRKIVGSGKNKRVVELDTKGRVIDTLVQPSVPKETKTPAIQEK